MAIALLPELLACTSPSKAPSSTPVTATPPESFHAYIRRTDFQISYVLEGSSQNGDSVQLISNPELSFLRTARAGATVARGALLGRAIVDPAVRRVLETGAKTSSIDVAQLSQLKRLEGPVVAPVDGRFTMSGGLPTVRAPGVDAVVGLLPIQYLRYRSLSFSGRASVETIIGERQVPCAAVWISSGGVVKSPDASGVAYELHCRLPSYVETGAGLPIQLMLKSKLEKNVVVIPNAYIHYDEKTDGYYVTIQDGGKQRRLPIMVGATDGVVRVVTSKVPVGATLLGLDGG